MAEVFELNLSLFQSTYDEEEVESAESVMPDDSETCVAADEGEPAEIHHPDPPPAPTPTIDINNINNINNNNNNNNTLSRSRVSAQRP